MMPFQKMYQLKIVQYYHLMLPFEEDPVRSESLAPNKLDTCTIKLINLSIFVFYWFISALEVCKQRTLNMNVASIPEHFSSDERTLRLTAMVPFDATCTVRIKLERLLGFAVTWVWTEDFEYECSLHIRALLF